MRLFVTAAALLVSTAGFAQTSATTQPAPAEGTASGATSSVSAPAPTAPAPAEATVAAPTMTTTVKKSPFSFSLYNRTNILKKDFQNRDNAPTTSNFLQAKYALTDTRSVGVRQEFGYRYPKAGKEGKATMYDAFVSYTDSKLGTFMGDGQIISNNRLYLPNGEASRNRKQMGALLSEIVAVKPVGKLEIVAGAVGVYFNQTQNSYMKPTAGAADTLTANPDYEFDVYLEGDYNLTPKVVLAAYVGTDNVWNRSVDEFGGVTKSQEFVFEPYVAYKPISNLQIIGSLHNRVNIWDPTPGTPFRVLRDDETQYRLAFLASL